MEGMETYYGCVRSPADAIKLFEACRMGLLPRVQRRLSEKERQQIRSGSVFVWDEREAGMRRWTDGKSWSASRVSGSFLTYREMEGKRGAGFGGRRGAGKTPDSGRGSDDDHDDGEPDGYRYKADGLMKQSFSITTTQGQHLHLISYLNRNQGELLQPTTDPTLRHVHPSKNLYPESSLNEAPPGPALTKGPMQQPYPLQPHPGPPHPAYQAQYAQQCWPPSPVATPPYTHSNYVRPTYPQPPPPALPPLQAPYPGHAHSTYPTIPPPQQAYRQPTLPPLGAPPQKHGMPHSLAYHGPPPPHPQHSPHMSHMSHQPTRTSPHDSPRSQQLQVQAKLAVQIEPPHASGAPRHHHGPLPSLITPQNHQNGTDGHPYRSNSVSPPRSSHSDSRAPGTTSAGGSNSAGTMPSLHALLHPTPSSSEPNSANPGSAASTGSSPRTANASGSAGVLPTPTSFTGMEMEEQRAKNQLDRNLILFGRPDRS
ncbi:Gti1/Pac2 family-domain-containing protein [Echria macrotheca]|uniref:Gti1/Pac2 family-domain-containing protein n=1 Tax=Echria macrotheca TaxID=438768 RepID=A0AAJ0BFD4_9PEZI|nr:Gti1/Pac2 family-domain-containing protein [Echria macrotheca]